jgi:hypothetical protein
MRSIIYKIFFSISITLIAQASSLNLNKKQRDSCFLFRSYWKQHAPFVGILNDQETYNLMQTFLEFTPARRNIYMNITGGNTGTFLNSVAAQAIDQRKRMDEISSITDGVNNMHI